MALDPLKRSRQRQGPSLALRTIGVQGYFGSVQPPPLSKIPGSAPVASSISSEIPIERLHVLLCPITITRGLNRNAGIFFRS